jgi:carboxypeptidase family protein
MRSLSIKRNLLISFAAASLLAVSVLAQTGTTSLRGSVTDQKGATVPGATVTITNPAIGVTLTTTTDRDGTYQFLELRPATYSLTVRARGFAELQQAGLQLPIATPVTNNVTLQVAGVTTIVEVSAALVSMNTQDATLGNSFTHTQIEELPFEGRDPVNLLSLQPGVVFVQDLANQGQVAGSDSRGGSVNGARSDQTNVTIDGIDNNDQIFGLAFKGALRATADSIEEFRVTTSNPNADQGRSSGAQVSLLTKSGTNHVHGSAYEYHRPTNLVANDFFNKHAELQNGEPNKPTFLLRNTFGGAIGGPIKKDRVFWFAAYEGQRQRENTQVTRAVPSATLRQGIILYQCADPTLCPGGSQSIQGVDAAFNPQMVTVNVPAGFNALGVPQIGSMDARSSDSACSTPGSCPVAPGVDPAVITTMNQYPLPNSNQLGDRFNFRAFTFSAGTPVKLDTYVLKLDANLTQSQRLFVRGGLQNDHASGASQFPGQAPNTVDTNNTKGIISGYTWTVNRNIVNNLRYGYIRQGIGNNGVSTEHFAFLRGLDLPVGGSRTTSVIIPVHNLVDDVSWTMGRHTIQFGGNYRRINNVRSSTANSFFDASTNSGFLPTTGFANKNTSLDPGCTTAVNPGCTWNFPAVSSDFANSYDFPMDALAGIITEVDAIYNRNKKGEALPEGTVIGRHFRAFELEWYLQDSWRLKPNLTLTYGIRYSLLQPPYEANGVQVSPTTSLHDFFTTRMKDMTQGQVFSPLVSFDLSGQANGKRPYWDWDYKNIAPRLSLAWSPGYLNGFLGSLFGGPGKSSIRVGAGTFYDHFGQGIVNTFDRNGSFGLTTDLTDPPGTVNVDTAPRYTGLHDIPATAPDGSVLLVPAPAGSFPSTPPATFDAGGFAIAWGLDDKLKTPLSIGFDASITRELPGGFVFEAAYVGRLGRRLLQQRDLAMPLNLTDPKSKTDYFTAATMFAKLAGAGTDINQVAPIPYWEDFFPTAAGSASSQLSGCAPNASGLSTVTATQAMYDLYFCNLHNETTALFIADIFCFPGCATVNGVTQPNQYFNGQWASLYTWGSIGRSSYNAGQFMLRHNMSHGLQWDFNYTYSKSIDIGSDAERISLFEGFGFGSQIINSFSPGQLRSPSDFDAQHQFNSNWVYDLPLGHGKRFGSGWSRGLDAVLGGWTFSGLFRYTSGLPFSIGDGFDFPTNWELTGNAVLSGPKPKTGTFTDSDGDPNVFQNKTTAINSFRFALPGESGNRNNLRGPGYFGIDAAVLKSWKFTESQKLSFAFQVFNLTNSVRFDAASTFPAIDTAGSFGKFSRTLTQPRRVEMGLRYTF